MSTSSSVLLPKEKCMKCQEECDLLLSSSSPDLIGNCAHKYCQSCFRTENINVATERIYVFKCPCCHARFYSHIQSIEEAFLIGEASTIITHTDSGILFPFALDTTVAAEDIKYVNEMNKLVIGKLESANQLNPTNFSTLYFLVCACRHGYAFLIKPRYSNVCDSSLMFYRHKLFNYSFTLIDHPSTTIEHENIKIECCYQLAGIFEGCNNYTAALKYFKLTYERCLRSAEQKNLSGYRLEYLQSRTAFSELPSLRFAVGDVVEVLHEFEAGSEWKLGEVSELYYWEKSFDINFTAPYRLKLLNDSDSVAEPPVYAWVKADIDRYVRKVGVRSIEDTRYQARLDAKVEELAQVFCSKEFIEGFYLTLAQDREFVDTLLSVWLVELSVRVLNIFQMCVLYRQPLARTDSGYHVPSSEEVIAGIKAYFDPAHHRRHSARSAARESIDSPRIRSELLSLFQNSYEPCTNSINDSDVQGLLLDSIRSSTAALSLDDPSGFTGGLCDDGDLIITPELADAISKVSTADDLRTLRKDVIDGNVSTKLAHYLGAWIDILTCLDNPNAGSACECPYVYFFTKHCIDQGLGAPKLAVALYDRMNMQLSREFIRCANPSCELNKLDQSTGKVKFKQCSRCKAVIYCSRDCQVAHYPEHKRLCVEHSTG